MSNLKNIVTIILAVLALVAVGYLLMSYNSESPQMASRKMMHQPMMMAGVESFGNQGAPSDGTMSGSMPTVTQVVATPTTGSVGGSEGIGMDEQPMGFAQIGQDPSQMNQLPSECYPKDVLSSADLLPRDANSLWAQVSPSGQGSLADQNFLTSGFHIGINTVGQTLRNANRQLRSEPLNPQVKVSPWQQTTIEPDINRRPLEIEGNL